MVDPIALAIGLASGALLGLTGAGGGVVAVPLLAAGLGLPLSVAAPMALLAVALTAAGAAIGGLRRGIVRYRAAAVIAVAGLLVAPLALQAASRVDERSLWLGFSALLALVAVRMFLTARRAPAEYGALSLGAHSAWCPRDDRSGRFVWGPRVAAVMAGIGALAGGLSGLMGVGGGFVIVPALRAVSDLDMHAAIATSLMAIALIAAGTVGWAVLGGHAFDGPRTLAYVLGAGLGTGIGRAVADKLPARQLQQGFAAALAGVALVLLLRTP